MSAHPSEGLWVLRIAPCPICARDLVDPVPTFPGAKQFLYVVNLDKRTSDHLAAHVADGLRDLAASDG